MLTCACRCVLARMHTYTTPHHTHVHTQTCAHTHTRTQRIHVCILEESVAYITFMNLILIHKYLCFCLQVATYIERSNYFNYGLPPTIVNTITIMQPGLISTTLPPPPIYYIPLEPVSYQIQVYCVHRLPILHTVLLKSFIYIYVSCIHVHLFKSTNVCILGYFHLITKHSFEV